MSDFRVIGTSQVPKDLRAKITGRAKYAEDFRADGMLFAKLLLSPIPRGRVQRLDASRALAMPGVHAVITAADVPDRGRAEPVLTDEPVYRGQPIAAVAAVDELTAARAVESIVLGMERLPFAVDPLDTLRAGGPNTRLEGNAWQGSEVVEVKWDPEVMRQLEGTSFPSDDVPGMSGWDLGDLETGFARSDLILEEPVVHQSQTHHPLEPRSAMAFWRNGKCHLHISTQSVAQSEPWLSDMLDLDPRDLVLVSEFCGGGFGSKNPVSGHVTDVIPAILSRATGRPVMLRVTRDEENYFGRARPGLQGWIKLGFRADGRLLALDLALIQDTGPYGPRVDINSAASYATLAYQPESMRFRGISVATNTPPRGAQRAPGAAQGITMLGPLMSRAANELGVDLVDLIKVNAPPDGEEAYYGPGPTRLTSSHARQAIDVGRSLFGWDEKKLLNGRVEGSRVTGVAAAISPYSGGSSGFDGLLIIRTDGTLTVHTGIGNLGTHSCFDTAMVAAEGLAVPWSEVEVVWGDTSKALPWSSRQGGSQTTHAHTRANWAAAQDAKIKLQEIAALHFGGAPPEYELAEGRVYRRGNPSEGLTFAQAAQRAIELGGKYDGHDLSADLHPMTRRAVQEHLMGQGLIGVATDTFPHDGATRSVVVSFARVEVDRETGHVDVKEILSVADCGTVLNPRNLRAQVSGAILQGISQARFENWAFDRRWGTNQNTRLYTAKPISILDVPEQMDSVALGVPDPQNPIGSKGVAEAPVGAGAAVVLAAVHNAVGIYVNRTPLTADRIITALDDAAGHSPTPYSVLQTHV